MAWYSEGTVSVTNNSGTVNGTGTFFSANTRVGDAFIGPDLRLYEVINQVSDTILGISPPYKGDTASGQDYAIAPLQGYNKQTADMLRQLTEEIGDFGTSPTLKALAAITPAANRIAMFTGLDTAEPIDLTPFAKDLLAAEDAEGLKPFLDIPQAPSDIGAATAEQGELAETAVQPAIMYVELDKKASAAQGALADTAVQPAGLAIALQTKVDVVPGMGLSATSFTQAEKDKLAGLESSKFQGLYPDLAALISAVPVGEPGFYAHLDPGGGVPTMVAIWDEDDQEWIVQQGSGGEMTPAQVLASLLANPDVNVLDDQEYQGVSWLLQGKLPYQPFADVRSIGCVLDSPAAAADNNILLQAALNAGQPIYLPQGKTCYVDYLNLPTSFAIIGSGTIAWAPQDRPAPGNMFTAVGDILGSLVDGVTIRGNRPSQTTHSVTGHDMMAFSLRGGSVKKLLMRGVTVADFGDGEHAGAGVVIGALSGTENVIEDVVFDLCTFSDISNVPGIYIDANSTYHRSLSRVKVSRSKFYSSVPADQNQVYFLGPSVTTPGLDVQIVNNSFEATKLIDCFSELNHIQGFTYQGNTHVLRDVGRATGLLIRDACSDGVITDNKFFNFGLETGLAGISLARLESGDQSDIDITHNKFYNWGAGSGGIVINLATGSREITVANNSIRSGPAGRIQTAIRTIANNLDIHDNVFSSVNYTMEIVGNCQRIQYERNKMRNCGDGAVCVIGVSVGGLSITNFSIKGNYLFTVNDSTPNFVSVVSTSAAGNRIENNQVPANVQPCNQSYAQWFTIVTPGSTGAALNGRVWKMSQGALSMGPGSNYIIGGNLDATLDGAGANMVVPGDTLIVTPPGSTGPCFYSGSIEAANRIRVAIRNVGSTSHDVPAGDWVFVVIKTSQPI